LIGKYIAKLTFIVRWKDLIEEFNEDVAEFIAQGVAKAGEEVDRDGGVTNGRDVLVICHSGV